MYVSDDLIWNGDRGEFTTPFLYAVLYYRLALLNHHLDAF